MISVFWWLLYLVSHTFCPHLWSLCPLDCDFYPVHRGLAQWTAALFHCGDQFQSSSVPCLVGSLFHSAQKIQNIKNHIVLQENRIRIFFIVVGEMLWNQLHVLLLDHFLGDSNGEPLSFAFNSNCSGHFFGFDEFWVSDYINVPLLFQVFVQRCPDTLDWLQKDSNISGRSSSAVCSKFGSDFSARYSLRIFKWLLVWFLVLSDCLLSSNSCCFWSERFANRESFTVKLGGVSMFRCYVSKQCLKTMSKNCSGLFHN